MIGLLLLFLLAGIVSANDSCDVRYELHLTWEKGSPDGFEREMIFVNGQFPGPTLQFTEGDEVEILVVNDMPFNSTVHYHGLHMTGTPWADGVPGLTQRPIQPGQSFLHKFNVDQYGSYFYHAHARGQIEDGLYGPIIIRPKTGEPKPFHKITTDSNEVRLLEKAEFEVQPLMLSDWKHRTSTEVWNLEVAARMETAICVDSLLVNGKGAVDCWSRQKIQALTSPALTPLLAASNATMTDKGCIPAALIPVILTGNNAGTNVSVIPPDVFDVCKPTDGSLEVIKASPKHNKWLALDIISTAGIDTFAFAIDEHPMWIYAVDGNYIEPLLVDAITIANGDRYSVFIELDKPATNYGIRAASLSATQLISTTAILSYDDGSYKNTTTVTSTPYINDAGINTTTDIIFYDQSLQKSFPSAFPQPAPSASQTYILSLQNQGASYIWALNHTIFPTTNEDASPPLLYTSPPPYIRNDVTITTKNATWIDLIFQVATTGQPPHPIHKHGNKAFIIGSGEGLFNYSSVAHAQKAIPEAFNLVDPPYRDGFVTPLSTTGPAWLAVRYESVNPGAWLMHCHIQSHLNGGMAMVILDGVDVWPGVPGEYMN